MAATVTVTYTSTTGAISTTDTFTLNDADETSFEASVMAIANANYQVLLSRLPKGAIIPPTPTLSSVLHAWAQQLFQNLVGTVNQYKQQAAAQTAMANVLPLAPTTASTG